MRFMQMCLVGRGKVDTGVRAMSMGCLGGHSLQERDRGQGSALSTSEGYSTSVTPWRVGSLLAGDLGLPAAQMEHAWAGCCMLPIPLSIFRGAEDSGPRSWPHRDPAAIGGRSQPLQLLCIVAWSAMLPGHSRPHVLEITLRRLAWCC